MGDDTAKDGPVEPDNRRQLLSYLAGFFDGEGCILARKRGNSAELALDVTQVSTEPLSMFCEEFGGAVTTQYRGTEVIYRWRLYGRARIELALQELLPYLRVKREQARLALELIFALPPSENRSPIGSQKSKLVHRLVDRIIRLKRT